MRRGPSDPGPLPSMSYAIFGPPRTAHTAGDAAAEAVNAVREERESDGTKAVIVLLSLVFVVRDALFCFLSGKGNVAVCGRKERMSGAMAIGLKER